MEEWLRSKQIPYKHSEPLSRHTTFRIGGPAEWFVTPRNAKDFCAVISRSHMLSLPCFVIGRGSNLLVDDDGIHGVVISTERLSKVEIFGQYIVAECGASLGEVCRLAQKNGRDGLTDFYGIPGSIGGAVYMNAGAMSSECSSVLSSVRIYDAKRDRVFVASAGDLHFSYRSSAFRTEPDWFVLGASFKTSKGDPSSILAAMRTNLQKRKISQPTDAASAGSFFLRTEEGIPAAGLIDRAGLKGKVVGGAQVSMKHAGFLVNTGRATASDVRKLAKEISDIILQRDGVLLRPEVIFWP